ncbi:MAG: VWA domain-containing protein, partial [Acidobacteriota bacterium]|nr:VWA domain-containing protein [Acidobacteriota bacterium]
MRGRLALWALMMSLSVDIAAAIEVFVHAPKERQVIFGEVDVEAEVLSTAAIMAVEIRLDGELVARLTEPPYRTRVDVGQENRRHVFEITATDSAGGQVTRTLVTGMVEVDSEVDLELQQLYVTVTRGGKRVLDLERRQFSVFDEGRLQKMVTFERGDVPLTAVLLIDSSLSMEGKALAAALSGARTFIENMEALDEAKVMVFSDRLLATTPFTGEPSEVSAVMESVTPGGSTTINDHLFLALKALDARQGRRVIVLLSDGLDVDSVLSMSDVEWKTGRVPSAIYWIRPKAGIDLDRSHSSVWRYAAMQRQEIDALERAVASSGGSVHAIEKITDSAEAFREILRELREQYVIGY